MVPSHAPVVIIGGGPVGLVCSALLSLQGIDHVVFERQQDTSIHPKAVGLNQRTIEIFRKIGIENEVLRQAAPPSMSGRTAWYTSFGPNGREICARDAWGGGPCEDVYKQASPCRYALLPQIRLEPILKRRALELNPDGIFYNHEVLKVDEVEDHVIIHVRQRGTPKLAVIQRITATFVFGCDGGRALANQLGIEMNGESDIVDMVTAHIRAPISKHRPDPSIFLHWFISPELGGSLKTGYLYHIGPYPMKLDTEEWVFACARLPHERTKPFTEEDMLQRMQQTLNIPDLEVELLSLSHWYVNAIVALRFRSEKGRVFLSGDAAHRIPPWGALGLNSGIQDADNLVWKLTFAMKHTELDCQSLLNSYDTERRPIGERVAKTSLYNMRAHAMILDEAIGLSPSKNEAENVSAMEKYFDLRDNNEGLAKRQDVDKALQHLDVEFYAHGAEVGWFYDFDFDATYGSSNDKMINPQLKDSGEMELCTYHPTVRPGSQLPHAWLVDRSSTKQVSTRELMRRDKLVLLSTSNRWKEVEHPLIEVQIVGHDEHNFADEDGSFERIFGDTVKSGAVIVRPDGIVGYQFLDDEVLNDTNFHTQINAAVQAVLRLHKGA